MEVTEVPCPVFLLSPARSCSSAVAAMLGQHPQLYGFPELCLFDCDTVGGLLSPRIASASAVLRARSGLLRAVAQVFFHGQTATNVADALAWLQERAALPPSQVFDMLRAAVAPRFALEKSPDTTRTPAALRRCLAAYPHAYFIHLTRHPILTMRSMVAHWRGGLSPELSLPQLAAVAAERWLTVHQRISHLTAELPPNRTLHLRAETCFEDFPTSCSRFCSWLGLRSDLEAQRAMQHPEASVYARPGPPNAPAGYDYKFLEDPMPRFGPVSLGCGFPAVWEMPQPTKSAIRRLAATYGYVSIGDDEV